MTTVSTPASSRSQRTPAPMSTSACSSRKYGLVAAVAGVPAEEPDAPLGEQLGQVVLGEVDVVVGGDAGHRGPGAGRPVVQALAGVRAVAGPGAGRRGEGDPVAFDGGHAAVNVGHPRGRPGRRDSRHAMAARRLRGGAPGGDGLRGTPRAEAAGTTASTTTAADGDLHHARRAEHHDDHRAPTTTTSTTIDAGQRRRHDHHDRGTSVTGRPDPSAPPPAFVVEDQHGDGERPLRLVAARLPGAGRAAPCHRRLALGLRRAHPHRAAHRRGQRGRRAWSP